MANDLVKQDTRKEVDVIFTEDVLNMYEMLEFYKQQIAMFEHQFKDKLIETLENSGSNSYSDDYVRITYVQPSIKKQVDVQKLKDEGIYEDYVKDVETKGYLKIKVKGANDE